MNTSLAGVGFTLNAGEEAEVDDELGAALCSDGRAERIDSGKGRKPRGKQATRTPRGEKR